MSFNIATFVKHIANIINRNELEEDMEASLDSIPKIVESYTSMKDILDMGQIRSKKSKELVTEFYKEIKKAKVTVRLSTTRSFATDIVTMFNNAKVNGEIILEALEEINTDDISTVALDVVKANYIRAIGHYYFMTVYALDLANYILYMEYKEANPNLTKGYEVSPKKLEFVENNMWIFSNVLAVYGDDKKAFFKKVNKLEPITIPKDKADEIADFHKRDKIDLIDGIPNGFIGSPIFNIRMMFAQWEASRYKKLKDTKRLLELRLAHLQLQREENVNDANLEKEIEYLQSRVTDIDYTLHKIESSVE